MSSYNGNVYKNPYLRYYDECLGMNNKNGINWVQGVAGAKSYNDLRPGDTVLLMDSEEDRLFIKTADSIGKPSIRVFRLTEELVDDTNKNINQSNIDMDNVYVKKDEIQDIILSLIGGLTNVTNEDGEFVQSTDVTERQNDLQKPVNKPKLKY